MKNVRYFLALSPSVWLCSPVKNTNIVDNGEQLRSDKISSNSLSENHSKGEVSIVNRMLPASDGRDISAETSMQLMSASQEETRLAYNNIENMLRMDILERKMLANKIDRLTEVAEKEMHQLRETTGEKIDQLTAEAEAAKKEMQLMRQMTEEKINELTRMARKNEENLMKAQEELVQRAKKEQNLENMKAMEELKELITSLQNERGEMQSSIEKLQRQLKEKEKEEMEKKEARGKWATAGLVGASLALSLLTGKPTVLK